MLLSFLVYTTTASALAWLGWHANAREQRVMSAGGSQLPFYCWEIVASIILFAIVAGARYKTGYDHIAYLSQYIQMCNKGHFTRNDYEIGFVLISKCFALVKAHEFFYFAFWGALQVGLFYFAFRNNKFLLPWLALVIMLGGYFVGWMNTMRQVVAECAFVAMIPACKGRTSYLWLSCVSLVLALIHASSLLIPLYLGLMIALRKVKLERNVMIAVWVGCIALGIYPFWIKALSFLPALLDHTMMHKYGDMLVSLTSGEVRYFNWGPGRIMELVSQLMLLWYYPMLKKHYSDNAHFHSFYCLAFVGMCMGNLLINTSHYLLRPIEYLTLLQGVVVAYALCAFWKTKRFVQLAVLSLVSLGVIYVAVFKAVYVPTDTNTPYLYNIIFCHR